MADAVRWWRAIALLGCSLGCAFMGSCVGLLVGAAVDTPDMGILSMVFAGAGLTVPFFIWWRRSSDPSVANAVDMVKAMAPKWDAEQSDLSTEPPFPITIFGTAQKNKRQYRIELHYFNAVTYPGNPDYSPGHKDWQKAKITITQLDPPADIFKGEYEEEYLLKDGPLTFLTGRLRRIRTTPASTELQTLRMLYLTSVVRVHEKMKRRHADFIRKSHPDQAEARDAFFRQ